MLPYASHFRQDFQHKLEFFSPPGMYSMKNLHMHPDQMKQFPQPTRMGLPEFAKVDQAIHAHNPAQSPNDNLPPIHGFFVGEQQPQSQNSPSNKPDAGWNPSMKTPPSHLPSIQNVITSPFGPTTPEQCGNSPSTPHSGVSVTPTATTPNIEGLPSPCTPHQYLGSPLHSQSYGNTPANIMHEPAMPRETILYSDCEESFRDSEIGGVAVAPGHGSVSAF